MWRQSTGQRGKGQTRLLHLTTVDLSLRFLLGDQLRAFRDAGFEVLGASAPGPWTAELEQEGITHVSIPALRRSWSPAADMRALIDLVKAFRRHRPLIVHTHTPKAGVLGRVGARIAGVPLVVNTVHGLYGYDRPGLRRWIPLLLEGMAARFSDFEFCQSQEDLDTLRRLHAVGVDRSAYLGNGVDLSRFNPAIIDRTEARERLGIGPDSVVVGTVGRLVWEKGYREFFAMADRFQRLGRHVDVLVAGPHEPVKRDAVPGNVIDDLSRQGTVRFLGMRADIPWVYRAMDIFVLPSYREGFPRSAVEAAAMGLPLVLTDIRGCREVVREGSNGFLIPPKDADALFDRVERLTTDLDLRTRLGLESRRRALAEFDEARVIRETLSVYRRLLRDKLGLKDGYRPESAAVR